MSVSAFVAVCGSTPLLHRSSFVSRPSGRFAIRRTPCSARSLQSTVKNTMQLELDTNGGDMPVVEETKLFVGNLSWDTTDNSLGDAFSRYGTVVEARVVTDRFTGKSRGFGFIEYDNPTSAEDALEGMNGYEVDGRRIRVDRANKRSPRPRREEY